MSFEEAFGTGPVSDTIEIWDVCGVRAAGRIRWSKGRNEGLELVWGIKNDELFRPLEDGFDSSGVVGVDFRLCCQRRVVSRLA